MKKITDYESLENSGVTEQQKIIVKSLLKRVVRII